MSEFQDFLNEQMKDPAFKHEWDAMKPERDLMRAMISARLEAGLTQKELAERSGVQQANISKIEQGSYNPSVKLLQRIAAGMGKELQIGFNDKSHP